MKFKIILLFILVALLNCGLMGQNTPLLPACREKVSLITDRDIFISGEKLLFSAMISRDQSHCLVAESEVLYVELLSPAGTQITRSKFLLDKSFGDGSLIIPSEILSGNYFLRAYTRYMRNYGPAAFGYHIVKIINPLKPEILKVANPAESTTTSEIPARFSKENAGLLIITDQSEYTPRSTVKMTLKGAEGLEGAYKKFVLSVVPENTINEQAPLLASNENRSNGSVFMPETRGGSVSGKLVDKGTKLPLPYTRINVSIPDEKEFLAVQTDSLGYFYISLPNLPGKRDLFLSPEPREGTQPQLLIDKDFSSESLPLTSPEFTISRDEREAAYKLAINLQVSNQFSMVPQGKNDTVSRIIRPFYGDVRDELVIDNFVQLPTMEEYFNELPSAVKVRKHQGKPYFKFSNEQPEMAIYPPLVLIDYIVVDDPEKLLAISPQQIEKIEYVNAPYVKGNITFGGILSVLTRRGDFGGIELPPSGIFVNYEFPLPPAGSIRFPAVPANVPDARNTLYWNPNLKLEELTGNGFVFNTPDSPGKYRIEVRGIRDNGEINAWFSTFAVK